MTANSCTICDATLPAFPPAAPPLCGSVQCQWTYQALLPHQRCEVCGRRLSAADQSAGACTTGNCWTTLTEQRRRTREEAIAAKVSAFAGRMVKKRPELRNLEVTVLRIPAQQGPITRVPARRRESMRRRLTRLLKSPETDVHLAEAWPVLELSANDERVVQAGCASCRGSCCRNGGDHAYLTHATLQRVQAEQPELSEEELVDRYISHATGRSYSGSCLYHQRSGCSLPRELRSDTCNNFFCEPLRNFIQKPELPVVIVAVDSEVRRGTVICEK